MIISVDELKKQVVCNDADEVIINRLESIESIIRAYTNNNFQNRHVRFCGRSEDNSNTVWCSPRHLVVGDTIQISQSGVNDGLYIVMAFGVDHIELDRPLFAVEKNLITKVEYPSDVVQCAVDLFRWKQTMGDKVGVKSETLSRHSVTYEDSATLYMGYPVGILNGLNLYKKARC